MTSRSGTIDWVIGDALGFEVPAHADALQKGGAEWLTAAFRRFGSLTGDGYVARITTCEELVIGGTGAKMLLSVDYGGSAPDLPCDLFVKFSRNFGDAIRDDNRFHMRAEVRFASLSCDPSFPIDVPQCLFTDFEAETGTGILITERVGYGRGNIEPHLAKCMDHLLPDALDHYRAIVTSLARLAGVDKSGNLGVDAERHFPLELNRFFGRDRLVCDLERLTERVQRLATFVSAYPALFPAGVADPAFLTKFVEEAPRFLAWEMDIKRYLHDNTDYIALCHWNANIDNAWFWREANGTLRCGLIDWGSVGQIHLAMALWGCLSGAETDLWDAHLEDLLRLFVAEYSANGGPALDVTTLRIHLHLYVMMMGLVWMLEAPARIRLEIPDPSVLVGAHDPLLADNELARIQLKITANMLNLWQRQDFGRYLRAGAWPSEDDR